MADGPNGFMRREHAQLRHLMRAIEGIAGAYHVGRPVEAKDLEDAVRDAEGFAAKCYQAEERRALFPAFRRNAPKADHGLIKVIQNQQHIERDLIRDLRSVTAAAGAGDVKAQIQWEKTARQLCDSLRDHLDLEEHHLLPAVLQHMSRSEKHGLASGLRRVVGEVLGDDGHHAIVHGIHNLELRYARWAIPAA